MKLKAVNQKFLKNLKKEFGYKNFSTKQAEKLYERDHWLSCNDRYEYLGDPSKVPDHPCHPNQHLDANKLVPHMDGNDVVTVRPCFLHWRKRTNEEIRAFHKKSGHQIDNWGEMSARNTLVAAVQHGLLRRIRKSIYTFRKG